MKKLHARKRKVKYDAELLSKYAPTVSINHQAITVQEGRCNARPVLVPLLVIVIDQKFVRFAQNLWWERCERYHLLRLCIKYFHGCQGC